MRIVALSDTHAQHRGINIPEGDLLIFAGDGEFCQTRDVVEFNDWLAGLPHPHKIVIAGNHDFFCEGSPAQARASLTNAVYLKDERYVLPDGVVVWGTPMTPMFMDWAFMAEEDVLARDHWSQIPADTDILVVHSPAYGHLDYKPGSGHLGSRTLALRIDALAIPYVIHGHIHAAYGVERAEKTMYVNCSIVDEEYQLVNRPVVIDL